MEGVAIDHIIPRARGGPNTPWNKQILHAVCNARKGDKMTPQAEALALARGVQVHEPNGRLRHQLRQRRPYTTRPEVRESMRLAAMPPSLAELMTACDDVLRPPRRAAGSIKVRVDATSLVHDYIQIADQLRVAIEDGRFRKTSLQAIAGAAGVSYGTVRRAIKILRDEGLVEPIPGQGTWVRMRP
jgi:GntR family transcriptional regulator